MTNWQKCVDILRKCNANDFRVIVFELAKSHPAILVKVVRSIHNREKESE